MEVPTPSGVPKGGRRVPQDMLLVYLLEGRNPTIWQTPITPRFPSLCPHTSHSGLQSPVPAPSSEVPRAGGNGRESLHHCVRETEREGGLGGGGQRQVSPHVKGAGAGSYYLLGSRCPLASPGSAGSSATEHRGQCQSRPGSERADTHAQRDTGVHRDRATRTAPMDTHTHATAVPMQLH